MNDLPSAHASICERISARRAWSPAELAAEFCLDEGSLRARLESHEIGGLPPSEWHDDWLIPYPIAFMVVDPVAATALAAAEDEARESAFAARLAAETPFEIAAAHAALRAMLPSDWTFRVVTIQPSSERHSWHHTVSCHLEIRRPGKDRVSIGIGRGDTRLSVLARGMHTATEARLVDSLCRADFSVEQYTLDLPSEVMRAIAPDGTIWFLAVPDPQPKFDSQAYDIYEALDDYGKTGHGIPWIVEPEYLGDPETLVAHLATVPPGGLPMPTNYTPYAKRR